MNKKLHRIFNFYIFTFLLLSDFIMFAQPGDDDNNGDLEGGDPAPAPINSKLILLLLAGVLFAIYTIRRNRKEA